MLSPIRIGRSNIRKSPEIRFDMTSGSQTYDDACDTPATRSPERSTLKRESGQKRQDDDAVVDQFCEQFTLVLGQPIRKSPSDVYRDDPRYKHAVTRIRVKKEALDGDAAHAEGVSRIAVRLNITRAPTPSGSPG